MARSPERLLVQQGSVVFSQGAASGAAYLVLTGEMELLRSVDGMPRRVGVRRAGDLFGEMALVNETPRWSTARAVSDCELLVISRDLVSDRIRTVDPLLRLCVGALLDRFGETAREVVGPGGGRAPPASPSIWSTHETAARDILSFEHQLRRGLEAGEFDLYFQPIVRLASRRLAGFEGLIRWRHPQRGLIRPDDFIPLAEACGAISDITTFCLTEVGRHFPAIKAAGLLNAEAVDPLFLSVNVSGSDLMQSSFAARSVSILCDAGVEPEDIRLEVTESILMADAERCAQTLEHCRDQGFKIAIDDFGTGYSSLNYLNALPISVLKMDRSFTLSLLADANGRKIIGAILSLGAELGLSVIAEGVEEEPQADLLHAMGCDFGQGYLFGRALDRAGTLDLIRGWPLWHREAAPPLRSSLRAMT